MAEQLYTPPSDASPAGPLELPDAEQRPKQPYAPKRPKKIGKKMLIIGAAVLVLAALAGGGWMLLQKKQKTPAAAPPPPPPAASQPADTFDESAVELKEFKNDALTVGFKYPADWTVAEKDGGIRVESPSVSYTSTQGEVTGNFRIYIRQSARAVDAKYIGKGVAIQPSETVNYTQPTTSQRKDTNISFFGISEPNNFAYFLVTSGLKLNKGDTVAANYAHEPEAFLVVGGFSAPNKTDDLNFIPVYTSDFAQQKEYKMAVNVIKSLQLY